MRAQALAVQQSLIGSVVCSRNCKSSLCSVWSCSRSSYPPYKLSSFLSYQFPMSFATKISYPLFHQPFLKTVGSHSSASTPERLHFAKPITFQKIPTKLISVVPPASSSQSSSVSLQPVEDLPPKLQEIVKLFQAVEQPKAKYEQLLFYGKNLKPLDAQYKTGENKVQGCVSQVWVRAYLDANKNVIFEADSDSVLTKGLAALLVQGLSGRPVDEIVRVSPDFVVLVGLQQSLTPSRNNGFLNMLKLMQKKALQLYVEAEKTGSLGHDEDASNTTESSNFGVTNDNGNENLKTGLSSEESGGNDSKAVSCDSVILGSRGMRIRERLERDLMPAELDVEDISYQHAGHAGVRGSDGETHFNVRVVSEKFEGKSLVKRHRLIYDLLQEELQGGLHALSIIAKTPSEVNSSPLELSPCQDGAISLPPMIPNNIIDFYLNSEEYTYLRLIEGLMDDPFIRNYIEHLLRNVRTQVLLKLIKPYTRIRIPFISKELNVPEKDVEELLVSLLDNRIQGHIDQVNRLLERGDRSKGMKKYTAIDEWNTQLKSLYQTIGNRVC